MRFSDTSGLLLAALIIMACIAFVLWIQTEREQDCYDRGGVELVSLRDNICIDADGRVIR